VVEPGAADLPDAGHFDLVDTRRVETEGALDTAAVGADAANSEGLVDPTTAAPNGDTFGDLDAPAVPLDVLRADANGIATAELRNVVELLLFNGADNLGNHNAYDPWILAKPIDKRPGDLSNNRWKFAHDLSPEISGPRTSVPCAP